MYLCIYAWSKCTSVIDCQILNWINYTKLPKIAEEVMWHLKEFCLILLEGNQIGKWWKKKFKLLEKNDEKLFEDWQNMTLSL